MSKRERAEAKKQKEMLIRETERSRMDRKKTGPQSEEDFRELLLSNNTSSALWMKYISFVLSVSIGLWIDIIQKYIHVD